jgi:hypothetical protein
MPCRVFLNIYSLGKEELLICLAEIFNTLIVVNNERYREIKGLGLRPELFTTKINEGWLLLDKKPVRDQVPKYFYPICPNLVGQRWEKRNYNQTDRLGQLPRGCFIPKGLFRGFLLLAFKL